MIHTFTRRPRRGSVQNLLLVIETLTTANTHLERALADKRRECERARVTAARLEGELARVSELLADMTDTTLRLMGPAERTEVNLAAARLITQLAEGQDR